MAETNAQGRDSPASTSPISATATFLAPWFPLMEAFSLSAGRAPTPSEHAALRMRWESASGRVGDRSGLVGEPDSSPFEPLPDQLGAAAAELRARPEFGHFRDQNQPAIKVVDLTRLISVQPSVINGSRTTIGGFDTIPAVENLAIWNACFPPIRIADIPAEILGSKITFSGPDLDMRAIQPFVTFQDQRFLLGDGTYIDRLFPGGIINAEGKTGYSPCAFAGFSVGFGNRFIIVSSFAGRHFLSNGYHRCVGALRLGITKLPCVALTYGSAAELDSDHRAGSDWKRACWSTSPPLLRDFVDPEIGIDLPWTPRRKFIRISVDEFTVPLGEA